MLISRFEFDDKPIVVETVCHPSRDELAVRVRSSLLGTGRLAVQIRFPYGTGAATAADWTKPDAHHTSVSRPSRQAAILARHLDATRYQMRARWNARATLRRLAPHTFELAPTSPSDFELNRRPGSHELGTGDEEIKRASCGIS